MLNYFLLSFRLKPNLKAIYLKKFVSKRLLAFSLLCNLKKDISSYLYKNHLSRLNCVFKRLSQILKKILEFDKLIAIFDKEFHSAFKK